MLTGKQEKFVRNLIKGMTQREAYKNSYDAENMSDKCIDEEACKLFNSPKIAQRYQELQDRLATATIMSAQERLEYLTGVVMNIEQEQKVEISGGEVVEYERPADLSTKIKAIDTMNKMTGEYVTRVDANVDTNVNIVVELVDE